MKFTSCAIDFRLTFQTRLVPSIETMSQRMNFPNGRLYRFERIPLDRELRSLDPQAKRWRFGPVGNDLQQLGTPDLGGLAQPTKKNSQQHPASRFISPPMAAGKRVVAHVCGPGKRFRVANTVSLLPMHRRTRF